MCQVKSFDLSKNNKKLSSDKLTILVFEPWSFLFGAASAWTCNYPIYR